MAEIKTKPTDTNVTAFINAIDDEQARKDCKALAKMMQRVTGEKPKLWGNGTVGYGTYHYKYPTGQEGEWYVTGFAPRKANLSITIMSGFTQHVDLMSRLGKHKTGKGCLYIKKLDDIDMDVLEELVVKSVAHTRAKNPVE